MLDPRTRQLANTLVNYSCAVKSGETVIIEAIDIPHGFTNELIRAVAEAGGIPLVKLDSNIIKRALLQHGNAQSWKALAATELKQMKQADCYIGVRGNYNMSELSDVPREQQDLYEKCFYHPVHIEERVKNTRWVVLRWPTASMAQMAEMSTEAFEDFFFNVCGLDYNKMRKAMQPLIKLLDKANEVHLLGPSDTDIRFSVKDIPAIGSCGHHNIPDGEVFTAPVRDSINGTIQYNVPTLYRGETHHDIRLTFKDGRIVEATSSQTDKLNEVLDSDEGSRYVGEFAIGFNPYCTKGMKDILFDEKMAGSIHLTPGFSYEHADNGNRSSVHWDMVMLQTPEKGGGKIFFDDQLIREDGLFVPEELQALNPENLR